MGIARTLWMTGPLLGAGLASASAAEWVVRPDQSSIAFEYQRAGAPADGVFSSFRGSGVFDPAAPENARLTLKITTESIDLFDTLASAFATSAEWFDSKNHPDVIYQLNALKALGDNRYEALGTITIRGESARIITPITLDISQDRAHATGSLSIERTNFLLGVGPSAAFVEIGKTVAVRFDLIAEPVN